MSESQGANDAKELYSEIVVENLSERSKGPEGRKLCLQPEGQSPEASKDELFKGGLILTCSKSLV